MDSRLCLLCSQATGRPELDLLAHLLGDLKGYTRRVVGESADLVVFPSVGALAVGHVLLCPKEHARSFALLDKARLARAEVAKVALKRRLEARLRRPVHIFEHGMPRCGRKVTCGVEHAHIHLLPADIPAARVRSSVEFEWTEAPSSLEEFQHLDTSHEYLYYQDPDGYAVVAGGSDLASGESQVMRKIFAAELGMQGEWNWREFPALPRMRQTLEAVGTMSL